MKEGFENLSEREKINAGKFLKSTFAFTDKQLAALNKEVTMTYELFESCLMTCIEADDVRTFMMICDQFPDMLDIMNAEIDRLEKYTEIPEERLMEFEDLCLTLQSKYGIEIN